VINQFVGDASQVVAELDNRKADVSRWVTEAGDAAQIAATRREDLRRDFELLPRTLAELRPYMVQLRRLADEQIPTLRNLRTAAPDVNRLLARLGPFADSARPAFRALGRASRSGVAGLRETRQEVAALRTLGRDIPGFAKPLRQFLETMDDRRRSVEDDPRATATAPPAPDKTAATGRSSESGFTGFEALWNYGFWQSQSINGRDATSHILRINALVNECSPYKATNRGEPAYEKCKQPLGPDQPGVTTPDPTEGGATSSSSERREASNRPSPRDARGAKREQPGEDANNAPSQPPLTPEGVRRRSAGLLDELLGGALGGALGGGSSRSAPRLTPRALDQQIRSGRGGDEMLLDFLLKP
nr:hypothetical protein [Actinomycetota bacterium]